PAFRRRPAWNRPIRRRCSRWRARWDRVPPPPDAGSRDARGPAMTGGAVRLIPFGGLGEFGMNCLAIESAGGDLIVVDAGLRFADERTPGAALLVPDFRWL